MEIVQEDVDKRVREQVSTAEAAKERETKAMDLRNIMASFGVTLERAMDSLKIPMTQRQTYAALVQGQTA